jgi:hypothetical protein
MALREVDLTLVRRSGEHFKKILKETFEHIPRSAQSIAGMARWTGINKSSCQRLVQAVTKTTGGLDVIITLPGPSALEQFNSKFKKLIDDQDCIENFQQLISEYQNLIFEFATSQSELKKLLIHSQAQGSANKDAYLKKQRKQAYQTNREITGESVDLYIGLHFIRTNSEDPNYIDEIVVANRVGVELAKNARPFVQAFGGNQNEVRVDKPFLLTEDNISADYFGKEKDFLMADFSTPGIERCFAGIGSLGNNLIYNHSLPPIDGKKFDITIAYGEVKAQRNPSNSEHKILCQSLMQRSPAKRIILLTLIEKQLDKDCHLNAGCYPSSMKAQEAANNPEELWSDRILDAPEVKLFNPEIEKMSVKCGLNHFDELIEHSAALIGDDLNRYVGYYLDVDYPLWLTSQRFYFDFS